MVETVQMPDSTRTRLQNAHKFSDIYEGEIVVLPVALGEIEVNAKTLLLPLQYHWSLTHVKNGWVKSEELFRTPVCHESGRLRIQALVGKDEKVSMDVVCFCPCLSEHHSLMVESPYPDRSKAMGAIARWIFASRQNRCVVGTSQLSIHFSDSTVGTMCCLNTGMTLDGVPLCLGYIPSDGHEQHVIIAAEYLLSHTFDLTSNASKEVKDLRGFRN
jgi:hypothetical protein